MFSICYLLGEQRLQKRIEESQNIGKSISLELVFIVLFIIKHESTHHVALIKLRQSSASNS